MAQGAEAALAGRALRGLVIVPDGCALPLSSIAVRTAAHPVPDRRGVRATRALVGLLADARDDPVICLIGGGASSLLVCPAPPITLADKVAVTRLLLASGADIGDLNSVRKHLSAVKGGGLLRLARTRPVLTLLISDVIGDDPGVIGSGPTVADATTFADALAILEGRGILDRVPRAVRERLERGAHGVLPETVKPGAAETMGTEVAVIGNNRLALNAAADTARRLGYEPFVDDAQLVGETRDAARRWMARISGRLSEPRACVISGGETTVSLRGRGRGGRNQEFALALVEPLSGSHLAVLSAGTDGIDGPTDAAGAFVDGGSAPRAHDLAIDPGAALDANDSYGFFDRLDDLLRCGPTGTNVMDLKIAVRVPFGGS
jgi:glycerate-2-kinase